MKTNRISTLVGILIVAIVLNWSGGQLFGRDSMDSDEDACEAEQRVYNRTVQLETYAEDGVESAILMLIGAVISGAILGAWLNAGLDVRRRAVSHAIAGGFACAVGGSVAGIWAIGVLGRVPSKTRRKLIQVGALWAMLLTLHFSSVFRPPINEILTANQELREKQQETAEAHLVLEHCREKHGRLPEWVEE